MTTGITTRADIEDLIARLKLRDQQALAALYDATSAKLYSVCLRILGDREEAEDVLHEVYLRIWNKVGSYAVTGHSPMTWLITVARNMAIDRLRKRQPAAATDMALDRLADASPGPEATAIARSESARIQACLAELETRKASAVRSAYLDGETYQSLATHHAVPLNTMRTWLRRSLMQLRDCLTR